jgi:hypothetical protein
MFTPSRAKCRPSRHRHCLYHDPFNSNGTHFVSLHLRRPRHYQ